MPSVLGTVHRGSVGALQQGRGIMQATCKAFGEAATEVDLLTARGKKCG